MSGRKTPNSNRNKNSNNPKPPGQGGPQTPGSPQPGTQQNQQDQQQTGEGFLTQPESKSNIIRLVAIYSLIGLSTGLFAIIVGSLLGGSAASSAGGIEGASTFGESSSFGSTGGMGGGMGGMMGSFASASLGFFGILILTIIGPVLGVIFGSETETKMDYDNVRAPILVSGVGNTAGYLVMIILVMVLGLGGLVSWVLGNLLLPLVGASILIGLVSSSAVYVSHWAS